MIKKLKQLILSSAAAIMLVVPVAVPSVAFAASGGCNNTIGGGISDGASGASGGSVTCATTNADGSNISSIANKIVNLFSIVVGAIAVIMIIYGGFRYITSGGDQNSVGSAKNTLIYAIVGLIIVALAQLIVHIVLAQSNTIQQ